MFLLETCSKTCGILLMLKYIILNHIRAPNMFKCLICDFHCCCCFFLSFLNLHTNLKCWLCAVYIACHGFIIRGIAPNGCLWQPYDLGTISNGTLVVMVMNIDLTNSIAPPQFQIFTFPKVNCSCVLFMTYWHKFLINFNGRFVTSSVDRL